MSARALQDVVVLAHHGCGFVDAVVAGPSITAAERDCFRAIDPRAFRADAERQHRIVSVVIAELPVTCAIVGLDAVYALFHDLEGFGAVVLRRRPLVPTFAARLVVLAGDVARLEGAVARARRRQPRGRGLVRAAGVEVVDVGIGALIAWQADRAALGDDVVAAVVEGVRLPRRDDDQERGFVLIEPGATGAALGACSAALAKLLAALDDPCGDDDVIARACELDCDDDEEARALINDLLVDQLLSRL